MGCVVLSNSVSTGGMVRAVVLCCCVARCGVGEGVPVGKVSSMCCGCRTVVHFVVPPKPTVSLLRHATLAEWMDQACMWPLYSSI
jgi:hypothetical protein